MDWSDDFDWKMENREKNYTSFSLIQNAVSKTICNFVDYLFFEFFVAKYVENFEKMQSFRQMFIQICTWLRGRRPCVNFWVHHFEQGFAIFLLDGD